MRISLGALFSILGGYFHHKIEEVGFSCENTVNPMNISDFGDYLIRFVIVTYMSLYFFS